MLGNLFTFEMAKTVAELAKEPKEEAVNNWFVIGMGIGVVFLGLIAIVIICKITSAIITGFSRSESSIAETPVVAAPTQDTVIENRQEVIAAVCAAAAEDMGTDITGIRVLSFKKL